MSKIDPSNEVNRLRYQIWGQLERAVELDAFGRGATFDDDLMVGVEVQLHAPVRVVGEWKRVGVRSDRNRDYSVNPNVRWRRRG